MKQCPSCQRTYTDERLGYCLEDGTALISISNHPNSFQPPPVITQPSPRVKYTPQETLRVPPGQFTAPYSQPIQTPAKSGGKGLIIAVVIGIFLLLVGGVAAFLVLRGDDTPPVSNVNTNVITNANGIKPVASLTPVSTPMPTATQLIGTWRTNVVENNIAQEINVTFNANGLSEYSFKIKNKDAGTSHGSWRYSDGTLFETYSDGASGKGSIKWIDDDTFDITIIDNGVPAYNGIVRRYRRVK